MAQRKKKTVKRKSSSRRSNKSKGSTARRRRALIAACETLLDSQVQRVEYPGGRSRESLRAILDNGDSIIATRRSDARRASIEVRTLRAMNSHGVPAPALLGSDDDRILLQEELIGERLTLALHNADEAQCEQLLSSALNGLQLAQKAATAEGLEQHLDLLGGSDDWKNAFLDRPRLIGEYLGVTAPELDRDALIKLLDVAEPRFVKWDSRPGNAAANGANEVFWFDWEHAGKRNRLDDMAWLLGDEFVPEFTAVEARLVDKFIEQFADSLTLPQAREYLFSYGCYHMLVRLGLILNWKEDDWWDMDYCIDRDKVGVTLLCAQRLCERGARWSSQTEAVAALSPWFQQIKTRIEQL